MINDFWNIYNNITEEKPRIIKSDEIRLNDNIKENVIIFPDQIFSQPVYEDILRNKKLPLEIITNLYLGDSYTYTHLANQFQLIINCSEELKACPSQYSNIIDLKLNSNEFIEQKYLLEILHIIDHYLKRNGKVLICSTFGINRSVIILCAYLMWKNKISLTKALTNIQKINHFANPDYSFMCHLLNLKNFLYNSN